MIALAKSSVLQVDFHVAVQASLAALAALARAAGSRGTPTILVPKSNSYHATIN